MMLSVYLDYLALSKKEKAEFLKAVKGTKENSKPTKKTRRSQRGGNSLAVSTTNSSGSK